MFQKALEMTDILENILKENVKTKELLPSQKRRRREIQLPDGNYVLIVIKLYRCVNEVL